MTVVPVTTWFRDDCWCPIHDPDGDRCPLFAEFTDGMCSHCHGHALSRLGEREETLLLRAALAVNLNVALIEANEWARRIVEADGRVVVPRLTDDERRLALGGQP